MLDKKFVRRLVEMVIFHLCSHIRAAVSLADSSFMPLSRAAVATRAVANSSVSGYVSTIFTAFSIQPSRVSASASMSRSLRRLISTSLKRSDQPMSLKKPEICRYRSSKNLPDKASIAMLTDTSKSIRPGFCSANTEATAKYTSSRDSDSPSSSSRPLRTVSNASSALPEPSSALASRA